MGIAVYFLRIRYLLLSALFIRRIKPSIQCPDLHDILYTQRHTSLRSLTRPVYISICHYFIQILTYNVFMSRSVNDQDVYMTFEKFITVESVFDDPCRFKSRKLKVLIVEYCLQQTQNCILMLEYICFSICQAKYLECRNPRPPEASLRASVNIKTKLIISNCQSWSHYCSPGIQKLMLNADIKKSLKNNKNANLYR